MSTSVEFVELGSSEAREQEKDRTAWNLPARPQERDRDLPVPKPDAAKALDREAFSTAYFPGSRRHNLTAIVAYGEYRARIPVGSEDDS